MENKKSTNVKALRAYYLARLQATVKTGKGNVAYALKVLNALNNKEKEVLYV